jgi:hypothetical protein
VRRTLVLGAVAAAALSASIAMAGVNPFDDQWSGPAQGGTAQVGFKIVKRDGHRFVKGFEFASVEGDCRDGLQFLDGRLADRMRIHQGQFIATKVPVLPDGQASIDGHFKTQSEAHGILDLDGRWPPHGHCESDDAGVKWDANKTG